MRADISYHVTEVPPLIQEVAVDVDAVGLGEIFGDQLPDRGEKFRFFRAIVLLVAQVGRRWRGIAHSQLS